MATVKYIAFKHHKKANGQINIKLCVYHKGERVYLNSDHTVFESQLKKDYSIKDKDIIEKTLAETLTHLKKISSLGRRIDDMTARELGEYLLKPEQPKVQHVDFIKFGWEHVVELKANGNDSTAGCFQRVLNNFTDFMKTERVFTISITSKLLKKYQEYLFKPYTQVRLNQYGKPTTVIREPMTESGLSVHMNHFRMLFNAARNKYNDLDTGQIIIPNYPFKAYKPPIAPEPEPRALPIETIRLIRDCTCKAGSRTEIGRDMFMLSFYMLGINAKDIYQLSGEHFDRVGYNRSKTKGKRTDKAFISVKIIPEAQVLLDKWVGEIQRRFKSPETFRKAIAGGVKQIAGEIGVDEFDFYAARHTVATEARNTLGFSVADVGEALNHTRAESRITDKYIKKDWRKIDEIQAGVVGLLTP